MSAISELSQLCKKMNPSCAPEKYYFVTTHETIENAHASFIEEEGITYVLKEKDLPRDSSFETSGPFALITLKVYSSLAAVGFLAIITKALAQEHISVNVISGYYHDHLFVPWDKRKEAIRHLLEIPERY